MNFRINIYSKFSHLVALAVLAKYHHLMVEEVSVVAAEVAQVALAPFHPVTESQHLVELVVLVAFLIRALPVCLVDQEGIQALPQEEFGVVGVPLLQEALAVALDFQFRLQ